MSSPTCIASTLTAATTPTTAQRVLRSLKHATTALLGCHATRPPVHCRDDHTWLSSGAWLSCLNSSPAVENAFAFDYSIRTISRSQDPQSSGGYMQKTAHLRRAFYALAHVLYKSKALQGTPSPALRLRCRGATTAHAGAGTSVLRSNVNNKSSIGKIVAKTLISSLVGVIVCFHSISLTSICKKHIRFSCAYV